MAQRCQRIGCDALFSPDNNPDGGCRYHPGPPLFHDGGKEWKCCKQRSHDFSLFLEIPGCATGKHTSEKPQTPFSSSKKDTHSRVITQVTSQKVSKEACARCMQQFYCSDHGTQPVADASKLQATTVAATSESKEQERPHVVDINAQQTCKNCKQSFTEVANHDTACHYHPGPPVFHDRSRGWSCCNVHVKEFDEFMEIPPCSKGWHQGT